METKALVLRHWDDVVFENRNKEYGAYVLRKTYSKKVIIGWGVSVCLMALLVLLSNHRYAPATNVSPPVMDVFGEHALSQPPVIDHPIHQVTPPVSEVRNNTNTTIQVVTEPVEATPVETVTSFSGGEGNRYTGNVSEGNGTIPVEIPTVIEPPRIVDFAEVMPSYTGGIEAMMKYIVKNLRYPASARRMAVEGTVFVRFIVNGDGSVSDVQVIRGFHPDCDHEAARVIAMLPGWIGGKQGNTPVGVRMVLPIKFKLD
jgi:protein TonB